MKRLGGCWSAISSYSNLYQSYLKARCGKADRLEVGAFTLNLEKALIQLQTELTQGVYSPGVYRNFTIYERKPRKISAAPFRDRVVHHAIMRVIEPTIDRTFITDSYACRKGKGVHAAVDRYQTWAGRYPYVLKMDISAYFASMDRMLLKAKLNRRIKDKKTLDLLVKIIDNFPSSVSEINWFSGDDLLSPLERPRGIPIGNLTSQFFANLYLDNLDHFIKHDLGQKAYLRYVDDLFLLGDSKTQLWEIKAAVEAKLNEERLLLHPRKQYLQPVYVGTDVLGYRVWPWKRELRNDNGHRFHRKLRGLAKRYQSHRIDMQSIDSCVMSWIGHAQQADTEGLRRQLFGHTIFTRGRDR